RDGTKVSGGMNALDHGLLTRSRRRYVVAGDPKASKLIVRIEDNSMPPVKKEDYPRLASPEIEALKTWVEAGAPYFSPATAAERPPPPPPSPLAVAAPDPFQKRCPHRH